MFISGVGTATPSRRYTQHDCWEAVQAAQQFARLDLRSRAILKKVLRGGNGIESRYLALNSLEEAFEMNPDVLHARFAHHAPLIATQAAQRALEDAKVSPGEIDAILISTCTGYLCPGLTSYLSQRLGLRSDVLCLDLVGQGCGAALPNLRNAEALIASGRCERVLSICVEICSAAFYLDDDAGVLISACLFGDGAGAAVLTRTPSPHRRRIEWKTSGTVLSTADRELLRFEQRHGMLRNILGQQVPAVASVHAQTVLDQVLAKAATRREQITTWIMHAGGRDVLLALREKLRLTTSDLEGSAGVLRDHGNLSSPFVLFVLRQALADSAPGGLWWMASFGAGFSSHGVLLQVD